MIFIYIFLHLFSQQKSPLCTQWRYALADNQLQDIIIIDVTSGLHGKKQLKF